MYIIKYKVNANQRHYKTNRWICCNPVKNQKKYEDN